MLSLSLLPACPETARVCVGKCTRETQHICMRFQAHPVLPLERKSSRDVRVPALAPNTAW